MLAVAQMRGGYVEGNPQMPQGGTGGKPNAGV
jgi:hypothetical protein